MPSWPRFQSTGVAEGNWEGFQTPIFPARPGFKHPSSLRDHETQTGAARNELFFRAVLDIRGCFDTLVHYCGCGHDLWRECPPLFQESRGCLPTPECSNRRRADRARSSMPRHAVRGAGSRARRRLEPPFCRPRTRRRTGGRRTGVATPTGSCGLTKRAALTEQIGRAVRGARSEQIGRAVRGASQAWLAAVTRYQSGGSEVWHSEARCPFAAGVNRLTITAFPKPDSADYANWGVATFSGGGQAATAAQ